MVGNSVAGETGAAGDFIDIEAVLLKGNGTFPAVLEGFPGENLDNGKTHRVAQGDKQWHAPFKLRLKILGSGHRYPPLV